MSRTAMTCASTVPSFRTMPLAVCQVESSIPTPKMGLCYWWTSNINKARHLWRIGLDDKGMSRREIQGESRGETGGTGGNQFPSFWARFFIKFERSLVAG